MRKIGSLGVVLVAVLCCIPQRAHAGGLFYAGSGTRALGRGAAFHVRADDPMALFYNPAKLADLDGTQFLANFNLALMDACVDPAGAAGIGGSNPTLNTFPAEAPNPDSALRDRGTYRENSDPGGTSGGDVTRYGTIPDVSNSNQRRSWLGTTMPKVCNKSSLLPIPNFVFTYQVFKKKQSWPPSGRHGLTLAFGMVTPGAVAKTTWGRSDGSVAARHATADQYAKLVGSGKDGDLGQRLPGGVRPDVVCDPSTQDCTNYCNPDNYDHDPNCKAGKQFYCDPNKYDCNSLPTPTRHMLVQQDPFAIPLTFGLGYRPLPWIAIGGAFTYQAFFVKNSVYAVQGQKSVPETDMKIQNTIVDWFVPAVAASTQITFMQGLESMAYFRWQDQIQADTKVKITDSADSIGGANGRVPVTTTIPAGKGINTTVPQPWEFGTGLRFALPRGGYFQASRPISRGDAMVDEWFDIEFDYVLEHNSSVKEFVLKSKMNAFNTFVGYNPNDNGFGRDKVANDGKPAPSTAPLTFLDKMTMQRHWKNQHVFRVGGDVNVVPGVLALRAGYNYETRGVSPSYQSIDSFPSQRQGVHGGFTWRISKALELSAAYAHLFQETITVAHRDAVDSSGKPVANRADLRASSPMLNTVPINAGTYKVHWDIFSVGITQRF